MKRQSDYKRILEYFIKVNTGVWLIIFGIIFISIPHFFEIFAQKQIMGDGKIFIEGLTAWGRVIAQIGETFLTVGLTFIIVDVLFSKYQEKEKALKQKGILNVFENRTELQNIYSFKNIVSKFEHIVFIGTKHSEFTDIVYKNADGIRDIIINKGKDFKIDIYFLNPNSEYKYLFDEDEKLPHKADLGQSILQHIKVLFMIFKDYPAIKSKINIYLHHTIPIGNITILDNQIYIINRYLFFEQSPKTLWFELSRDAADTQRIRAYFNKIEKDKPRSIKNLTDLKPLENLELKELLTVLDAEGKPTNFNRAREIIHRKGYLHRSVHIWIANSNKEVLLQKRGVGVEISKNLWGCACTGHIIAGKSSLEAAIDEVYQELGLDISPIVQRGKIVKLGELSNNFDDDENTFHDNEINDVYLIETDKKLSEFTIEENIVEEIKYMNYIDFENDYKANPNSYVTSHKEEHKLVLKTLKKKFDGN